MTQRNTKTSSSVGGDYGRSGRMVRTTTLLTVVAMTVVGALGGPCLDSLSCGDVATIDPHQSVVVQSPKYPSNYGRNVRCQYVIRCRDTEAAHFEFRCPDFQLEDSVNCRNDRFMVEQPSHHRVYCGTYNPSGSVASTGEVSVTFVSNSRIGARGYQCFISCYQNTTPAPVTTGSAVNTTLTPTTATASSTTNTQTTSPPWNTMTSRPNTAPTTSSPSAFAWL